ncbi:hypothetical protein KAR10_03525 [bacterium]|nr:hypothetical protein [bacterium]
MILAAGAWFRDFYCHENSRYTSGIAGWAGITDQGKMVSQGVYFYLVTNEAGKKREGKITIVQ